MVKKNGSTAIIFNDFNAPAQPYVTMCAEALKKTGAPVIFFSNTPVRGNCDYVATIPILKNKLPIARYFLKNIFNNPDIFLKWLWHTRDSTFKDIIKGWAQFASLAACNPRVIHLANSYLYYKYSFFIKKFNCLSITTFRGYEFNNPGSYENDQDIILNLMAECNYLHFVSNYLCQEAIRLGALPEKTIVIYPGIDTDFYCPTKNIGEYKDDKVLTITTVGRLVQEKGYHLSFAAIKALVDYGYRFRYQIIGWGPARNALEAIVYELGIQNHVKFMGYQPPEQIKYYLGLSDIYLQPSFFESLCVAAIEASAMELPVIASNVGGLPEVVDHNNTGLLVPPNDYEALSEAIFALMKDKVRRKEMGKHGRRLVEGKFSLDREVKEWLQFYEKIMVTG